MSQQELPELDSRPQGRREWSGWLSSLVLPLAFITVLIGVLLYWQSGQGGREDDDNYGTVTLPADRNSTGQTPQAAVDRAAPNFLLSGIGEAGIELSNEQGRPVIVSFFTTWCDNCRVQMPLLVEAANSLRGGVTVIAINLQESEDRVVQFANDYGATFPILFDHDGDVSNTWRVGGKGEPLPATFFIDSEGVIRKVLGGPITAADLRQGVSLIAGGQN